ncbi:DUF3526 domain-containing protein [Sessilibacter corallicola]|uniref:DUF3526 domain-containing protein n=1 Tax=Sessilibacter corallicola TaxID=2904075 RepID=UPI001E436E43|nr:DUF3526 domain-containing protein [Sessilibacter corallicola]MCE2028504.1 DUF3526 domain-containing protein [Sessilibacter corallicola]
MSTFNALMREIKFTARDRTVVFWMVTVLGLSAISLAFGLAEVKHQQATIQQLLDANQQERDAEFEKLKDWGSAAYYTFHLTYDAPSDFAFAALGQRDVQPWKHRIRMLALEGQIYERDVGNPSIALIGRFDFAFFTAFIVPLVLIILLYDLRASEKTAGRYNLLEATVGQSSSFWFLRAAVRSGALFLCLIATLFIAGMIAGTAVSKLLLAGLWVLIYIIFWTVICFFIAAWRKPGSVILMTLITVWVSTAVILPALSRLAIDKLVPVPPGADILMMQRETVNDAWDLPRETTMNAFFEEHPQWSDYQQVESSFEWQWYYAFQQVGDQKTRDLSTAYQNGRLQRADIAAWVSLLAPPSLLERSLQALANTDLNTSIDYEESVRAYHAALREFYYPKFFLNQPFDKALLKNLPKFEPNQ